MSKRGVVEIAVTAAIFTALVFMLGTGPFIAGLRSVTVPSLVIAVTIGAATTAFAAWRWRLFARSLGLKLPLRGAIAAYYRSQFLNVVLPAGVLGDVDRAVRHGLEERSILRAGRAVAEERIAGQLVQVALTIAVLAVMPSPVPAWILGAVFVALVGITFTAWRFGHVPSAWPMIAVASLVVVMGHTATFVLAAHTVGVSVSWAQLVPLALLVLMVAAIPFNVGGWGPREGAAVWAFEMAGLSGSQGLTVSVAYGVFAFAAALPGAIMLMVPQRRLHGSEETVGGSLAHG